MHSNIQNFYVSREYHLANEIVNEMNANIWNSHKNSLFYFWNHLPFGLSPLMAIMHNITMQWAHLIEFPDNDLNWNAIEMRQ